MKAIVYHNYGSPDELKLAEVAKPAVGDDELLVKVRATGANAADWRFLRADPFFVRFIAGLFKPKNKILGADVAGVVEAVGKDVTQFRPGDAVYGELAGHGFGGFAEYVSAPEHVWASKPANLTFEQTAAVPMAAVTALQGLRDIGQIKAGDNVLINGASGGVGTFAVQIAKGFGATVTAVCSTSKMEQARVLGADRVIDYTREDFTQSGELYDLIFSANGNRSLSDYIGALTPTGRYVMAGGSMSQMFSAILLGPIKSKKGGKTIRDFTAKASQKDLIFLNGWLEAGKIVPMVDRCYPLAETAEAMRYLEAGHAKGKIVVTMDTN